MSWELLSLQELSEVRSAAESGSLSLSSAEYLSLLSEVRERWSEVQSLCWCGPAGESLSSVFALRRAKCWA
mgnify:CR=1 FL=1